MFVIGGAPFVCGCHKTEPTHTESAAAVAADPVDTTQLHEAFASATPGLKIYLDESLNLLRVRNFSEALEQFQKLSDNGTLTPAQKAAVTDMITKVQNLAAGKSPS